MICTSVISNIDSTICSFKDENLKGEATALRTYLHQAISLFVASDAPQNPPVPLHSRPAKGTNTSKTRESNKPVAVATPAIPFISPRANNSVHATPLRQHTLPQKPQLNGSTWVTVARKGLKKARIDLQNSQSSVIPPNNFKKTVATKHADGTNAAASHDPRLFVRLPREHEWRKLSPAGLRELVVKRLSISPSLIGKIKLVNSGFALSPSSSSAREELLKAENGLFLSGAKLEAASNWVQLLIPTVPTTISRLDDRLEVTRLEVTKTMLMDEIERVTSVRPVTVKLFGYQRFGAPHRTWMAFFSKAPRPGFRVFDESGMAAKFKKQRAIDFCKRCNGHHSYKTCSRAPSCGNCGSTMHAEDECKAPTRCRNCGGPHRSDSVKCLARPNRAGAPTKEQLKIYRQVGDREYQLLVRVKAAESKAAAAASTSIQDSSSISTTEDIQASPAEEQAGDEMRL